MKKKRQVHTKTVEGLASHLRSMLLVKKEHGVLQPAEEEDAVEADRRQMIENLPDAYKFHAINEKVEQKLLSNPLAIPGCGLPQLFKELFDKKSESKVFDNKAELYRKHKNHQIYLDSLAVRGANRRKQDEQILFEELHEYLKPVQKVLHDDITINESRSRVAGIQVVSDGEREEAKLHQILSKRFISPQDRAARHRNQQQSKRSLHTIGRSGQDSKASVGLSESQLARALRSLDVDSETSGSISVPQSSSASIYQDIQTRLQKEVYHEHEGHRRTKEKKKPNFISRHCPADELMEVMKDIVILDDEADKKDRLNQEICNHVFSKKRSPHRELGSTKGLRH